MSHSVEDIASSVDVSAIQRWLSANQGDMVEDLCTYVSLPTPSHDKECLTDALRWIEDWVQKAVGDAASIRRVDGGEYGDTLTMDWDGVGDGRLLLLCHYDTVWGRDGAATWKVNVSNGRVTGPGVFDMKAGLVQAVWALRAARALDLTVPPVRLLLNGDEEIGSPASAAVIEDCCDEAVAGLVFESSADGALKTSRAGWGIYGVHIQGVEAHAGLDPDKGVGAVEILARLVLEAKSIESPELGSFVNVGVARGGTRPNVIAGEASAEIDVRVRSSAEASRVDGALRELGSSSLDSGARVTVTGGWNRPVMERSQATEYLYRLAERLALQLGVTLREASVGGVSDGNFLAGRGVPVLDGLGAVGGGAHARHEYIEIDGMVERSALAASIMHAISRHGLPWAT